MESIFYVIIFKILWHLEMLWMIVLAHIKNNSLKLPDWSVPAGTINIKLCQVKWSCLLCKSDILLIRVQRLQSVWWISIPHYYMYIYLISGEPFHVNKIELYCTVLEMLFSQIYSTIHDIYRIYTSRNWHNRINNSFWFTVQGVSK